LFATRALQAMATSRPPPSATLAMAGHSGVRQRGARAPHSVDVPATVGLGPFSSSLLRKEFTSAPKSAEEPLACCFARCVMSKPALNLPPSPVTTMATTEASACALDRHSCRLSSTARSGARERVTNHPPRFYTPDGASAFMGGLESVMTATSPSTAREALMAQMGVCYEC